MWGKTRPRHDLTHPTVRQRVTDSLKFEPSGRLRAEQGVDSDGIATPRRRVLMLAHRIPYPPDKGDKIRSYRWFEHLSQTCDLYLACFVDDPRDRTHIAMMQRHCRAVVALQRSPASFKRRAAWTLAKQTVTRDRTPLTVSAYDDARLHTALAWWRRLVEFDAVLAYSGAMAPYALAVPAKRRVLDLCDCDSQKWLDYASTSGDGFMDRLKAAIWRREGHSLQAAETLWLSQFDAVTVVNDKERQLLACGAGEERLHVVGNGVTCPAESPVGREQVLGFVGALDYEANIDGLLWFVREVWPLVRRFSPAATFQIVGRNPGPRIKRLAMEPGVSVIGDVPDVEPYLRRMRASVVPLRVARGVQNKVLEAMAFGRPVVTTSAVAEGLLGDSRRFLCVADDPPTMATEIGRLLSDGGTAQQHGRDARAHVTRAYGWRDSVAAMDRLLLGSSNRSTTPVPRVRINAAEWRRHAAAEHTPEHTLLSAHE